MSEAIDPLDYYAVQISLASSEQIQSWSHGEIKSSETINYRTFKPERDGLFCGKIFGPVNDYECICGKYKRMKHRGITCEKCGVEVIQSKVRRERLGHIKLACPVSHVWFLKGLPSRLGNILDMTLRDLERVLYFDGYIVIDPSGSDLQINDVIDETQYRQLTEEYPEFVAGMGAEAIQEILNDLDIPVLSRELREDLREATSEAKRKKIIKRLKIVEAFKGSGINPANMVLEVIPVISPELRPLVPLEGGRFATSDLNDLYRRVIHRNNRLKRLMDLNAPEIIVKNEKRMLQEAVDALFDNGRRGRPILGTNKRPLKSLSDSLKGKSGRFRQNLLGKRVDYSGRTVIVVGPSLKLNQCGLPKKMALELFKPFIFNHLIENGKAATIKVAKKMVENKDHEIWAALDAVIVDHPVMLNRAPTLHRLGIQAFIPKLIEGKAVQLHPLVCSAFNADFDGDQMAVHLPLSVEAQMEAKVLMMSTNNILSPATGKPAMTPTQDMVLGIYWMTRACDNAKGEGKIFPNPDEVVSAYDHDLIHLQAKIKVRIDEEMVETTTGRVLLYDSIPKSLGFETVNRLLKKKDLENLIDQSYRVAGNVDTVDMLDSLKDLGFYHAAKAGFSICMSDMKIPAEKEGLLKQGQDEVREIQEQHDSGIITDGERYNKVIDIWSKITNEVGEAMKSAMAEEKLSINGLMIPNPIFVMADSGARGSEHQSRQLGGMRGLMAKPTGEIIETPITANFREGLNVLQYFISTHGARKGLADTALKTANSGYLTRRLVDVSQDSVISTDDCGTHEGIWMEPLMENGEIIVQLGERILGRVTMHEVLDPYTQEEIIPVGSLITEAESEHVDKLGVEKVKIRSVLTCERKKGICALCYGRDLARGSLVSVGEAVGVISAQSIGEPGTQLTMRTFHIGGTASRKVEATFWEARSKGVLTLTDTRMVKNREGTNVLVSRKSEIRVIDEYDRQVDKHMLPVGAQVFFNPGDIVEKGQKIAEWDPFSMPIISDSHGKVKYDDVIEGRSLKIQRAEDTGYERKVIVDAGDQDLKPRVLIKNIKTGKDLKNENGRVHPGFYLPTKAEMMVNEGDELFPGDIIARVPRETTKNKDITGGLPRVAELFEARSPKDPSQISDIDGIVEFGEDLRRKRRIIVRPEVGEPKEYLVPKGKHIVVVEGDYIRSGEPLTDGSANPHDILRVKGVRALQRFLVDEVQEVYRLQGVKINDKHIEVITRQMLRKVRIVDPGDAHFLVGEAVSRPVLMAANEKLMDQSLRVAIGEPLLLGITKAALSTDSFISAASFQETTKVLTEASINGKLDTFNGLKENVIIGRLIPAGTGFPKEKVFAYKVTVDEEPMEVPLQAPTFGTPEGPAETEPETQGLS
ncbi:MAG: DNA-directed RNA polymerase subunit beta' [SAR324 cluster bacterium]|uniref:DNA-directed RNA polymerase subunit beta' n=1 Tax=SAR324 cluster bacterium TaxID=2024889 RepID=A0A2A4T570_9DELT|nr:MAG: DNA-directed RNA polymerase subunit beta' [SAR324 cluster bacterium]